ncbi:10055_t:CDS:2 [Rhizophagus irregularis]|nr:10055_t:CDS:2 [Rhizophagus irregularis]
MERDLKQDVLKQFKSNYSRGRPSSEDVRKHFEKLRKTPRQKCVIIVEMTLVIDLIDRLEDYII